MADRDSVVGIATGYGLDDPGIRCRWEPNFPQPSKTYHGAYPGWYTMGTGSFSGVMWSGSGVDRQPKSSAEVKERIVLCLYSPSGTSRPVLEWILPLFLHFYTCRCSTHWQKYELVLFSVRSAPGNAKQKRTQQCAVILIWQYKLLAHRTWHVQHIK